VKADAYGLGAERVANALYAQGCRHFFVAQFCEARSLRPCLPADAAIFVLNGLQPGNEVECVFAGIVPVINSLEQWQRWVKTAEALCKKLPAIVQFDTGMSRLGLSPEERMILSQILRKADLVDILFVMSHLASADTSDSEQNGHQLAELDRITSEFPGLPVCLANSGGIFLGNAFHGALARPGIAIYGGNPTCCAENPMEPVLSLHIAVVQTRKVPPGTRVGYAGDHVTTVETRLATLAAGYADGLPRSLSNHGSAYYNGARLPIVGRVSMDSMTIDISGLPEDSLQVGSMIEVIGPTQSLEDVAKAAGTISYEILTGLGRRYHRRYL
jgi:alanine racemase